MNILAGIAGLDSLSSMDFSGIIFVDTVSDNDWIQVTSTWCIHRKIKVIKEMEDSESSLNNSDLDNALGSTSSIPGTTEINWLWLET